MRTQAAFSSNSKTPCLLSNGLRLSDRLFVRMPLRCRNCLTYGHHEDVCSDIALCTKCALPSHQDEYTRTHCAACGGPYAVTDPGCSIFRREMAAKRLKITEGLTREAALIRLNPAPLPAANPVRMVPNIRCIPRTGHVSSYP